MGNAQGGHHHLRRRAKHVVTVLQGDGRVLEFSRSLRVADLLYEHPRHFVCHSSALVLLQHGKMLPPDTLLLRGEVYFLLPLPKDKSSAPQVKDVEREPLLGVEKVHHGCRAAGTMKFLITKQQLAKILAEGSIKMETKAPEPAPLVFESNAATNGTRVLHRPSPATLTKRSVTWSPGLESISEVPVM